MTAFSQKYCKQPVDFLHLNQERLDCIFDHVYDNVGINEGKAIFKDEKLADFFDMLKFMQNFNFRYRGNDTYPLFHLLNDRVFIFERNSEGTTLWLALILAIKELYGFSDEKLISVLGQVSVRK